MCDDDRPVYWWEEPCNWRAPDLPRHCYTCHCYLSCQGDVKRDILGYHRAYDVELGYCVMACPPRMVNATSGCPHWKATVHPIGQARQALLLDLYQRIHRVLYESKAPGDGTLEEFAAALRAFLKGVKPEEGR